MTKPSTSTRGGARAYLEMLKSHKDKGMVVTPDGPRGPKGVVQEGIIKTSERAVAVITGNALKDVRTAISLAGTPKDVPPPKS